MWKVIVAGDVVTALSKRTMPDRPVYKTQTIALVQDLLSIMAPDGTVWRLGWETDGTRTVPIWCEG